MVSKRKPYKRFTPEFKLEALRQLEETTRPATELAKELGIRPNLLYNWRDQLMTQKKPSLSSKSPQLGRPKKEDQSELTTLKQENKRLQEEIEILKKAAAYFAKELK